MIRGERFELNLSDSEDEGQQRRTPLPAAFVGDVLERKPAVPKPPSAPTLKNKTGFPEHKKRTVESKFKKQKSSKPVDGVATQMPSVDGDAHRGGKAKSWEEEEKGRIDEENRQKIAAMSSEEIDEERKELLNSFGAGLLQRLLERSNIADGSNEVDLSRPMGEEDVEEEVRPAKTKEKPSKTVTFEEPPVEEKSKPASEPVQSARKLDNVHQHNHSNDTKEALANDGVHFPRAPQPPELDPSSETFLEDLHQKYFPLLPSDPDKLEWMQPVNEKDSLYDPSATAFNAKDIRFSFRGELLAPKTASEIPVTAGLHHHGDAPDAAGYTIGELAHLSRSTYPAQRCIAFQTLGRILYRLSKGEFGDAGEPGADRFGSEDTFGELARGLWREVERLTVIQILIDESEGRGIDGGRHLSAKTYATEAVWLWRKGGGRRWKAE